ncbi:hypothetical protein LP415_09095 [Polaromonas sp. P1(28)-8]|nr:hypothetical protein LP415_09095 [Polaromonas sp. P1(28)-8]
MLHAQLSVLESGIRERLRPDRAARPFLCSGSPYGCEVAIVGINPGTNTPFWEHWSSETGFSKATWLAEYKADARNAKNQTRPRIEILVEELTPIRVIELNLYPYVTKTERELTATDRDANVFSYLLDEFSPGFLFAFGRKPAEALAQYLGIPAFERGQVSSVLWRGRRIQVLVESHLSRGWSYERVRELARCIRTGLQENG